MQVYRLNPVFGPTGDSIYRMLVPPVGEEWPLLVFNGQAVGTDWIPLSVEVCDEDRSKPASDFTMVSWSYSVVSDRAIRELGQLLTRHAELLPLRGPGDEKWSILNVTTLIDALDEANSELDRWENVIMWIHRYVFYPDRLKDIGIFQLPRNQRGDILVTDAFVDRVRALELIGFGFELVWEG